MFYFSTVEDELEQGGARFGRFIPRGVGSPRSQWGLACLALNPKRMVRPDVRPFLVAVGQFRGRGCATRQRDRLCGWYQVSFRGHVVPERGPCSSSTTRTPPDCPRCGCPIPTRCRLDQISRLRHALSRSHYFEFATQATARRVHGGCSLRPSGTILVRTWLLYGVPHRDRRAMSHSLFTIVVLNRPEQVLSNRRVSSTFRRGWSQRRRCVAPVEISGSIRRSPGRESTTSTSSPPTGPSLLPSDGFHGSVLSVPSVSA